MSVKTFQIENLASRAKGSITTLKRMSESKRADWQQELLQWEEQSATTLTGCCDDDTFLSTFVLHFVQAVLDNLSARFPDEDIYILSAGEVFLPSKFPSSSSDCYFNGRNHISTLAHHYRCNVEETLSEWKEVIFSLKQMTMVREVLHYLAASSYVGYPNLAK